MDDIIRLFIETYYTEEIKRELYKSLSLFSLYEHNEARSGLEAIVTQHGLISNEDLVDTFRMEIITQLDYVLKEHTIVVTEEATISHRNEILSGLFLLQDMEDYTGVIRMLESMETDETMLVTILSDVCAIDETELMTIIGDFSPRMLLILKEYIYEKEESKAQPNPERSDILENYKSFLHVCGKGTPGEALLKGNMLLGSNFAAYHSFVSEDLIVDSDDLTAANILSIIYLTENGWKNPLVHYRFYSEQLIKDLPRISRIDGIIMKLTHAVSEYNKGSK